MNFHKCIADIMDNISFLYMSHQVRNPVSQTSLKKLKEYCDKNYNNFYDEILKKSENAQIEETLVSVNKNYEIYNISFSSPIITPYKENNIVRGRKYFVGEKSPSVIILHGWRIVNHLFFDGAARELAKFGFNSVLFDLPYHIKRTPKGTFSGEYMLSPDIIRTMEAIKQSLVDATVIINNFYNRGIKKIGVFGVSLGGMLSSLLLSFEKKLSFGILINPASDPRKSFLKSKMQKFIIKNFDISKVPLPYLRCSIRILNMINPMTRKILIDKNNLLLITSLYDNMMPPDFTYNFWLRLGCPPHLEYPHGHLSVLFLEKRLFPDIKKFLTKFK